LVKLFYFKIKKDDDEDVEVGLVELFVSSYKQTDNIFTWIDRLCNYSYIRFENEPAPTLRELFSQKIFDKPIVMKVVQNYILSTMKPIDGEIKFDFNTEVVTPKSGKSAVDVFLETASPASSTPSNQNARSPFDQEVKELPPLPEDVQEIFSILYIIGKRPQHFGGEFKNLVEPYVRFLLV
jgi:hypothetical protein